MVARTLGIPNDVVDATEHLLSLADDWSPRKIDLGMVDARYFVFACGVGIDATVVRRVDANPKMKAKGRALYYSWAGVSGFYRRLSVRPVRVGLRWAAPRRSTGSPRSSRIRIRSPTLRASRSSL